jgi:lysophospholipase L1-like esterase/pimeloyl-ACP methyl ester carboxylesterase
MATCSLPFLCIMISHYLVLTLALAGTAATALFAAPVRVACVGDSITAGSGTPSPDWHGYPAQLQRLLGDGYMVGNFGVSGATLLNGGDKPYQHEAAFKNALGSRPDVVVIQLGTNDTKPQNWAHEAQFSADYADLVRQFQALPSKPRIFLSLPPFVAGSGNFGITESVLLKAIPLIQAVAKDAEASVVDVHGAFLKRDDLLPDRVHPNPAGAALLARTVYTAIVGKSAGKVPDRVAAQWNGYERLDYEINGRRAILISPKNAAPGRPWIWRTEFFGAFPAVDIALLAKGWHVAYYNVSGLYGAPIALDAMDGFHAQFVADHQLAPKPVLEGFSRGGLYAFNWAARNPGKVAALYVDAPVCDFKSWPGAEGKGEGGSPSEWKACLKAYRFTEEQALAYKLNPLDKLAPLASAKIPIIAVAGDADNVVPMDENISIVERRYRELGGEIRVIIKPCVGHHPHSLTDPTPVVDFLIRHFTPAR